MEQDIECKINDLLDNKDKTEIQKLKEAGIDLNNNILNYAVTCNNEEYTKIAISNALLDYNDAKFNRSINVESEEQNKHSHCICVKTCDDNSPYALQIREQYNNEILVLRNEVFLDLQGKLSKCDITEKFINDK